MASPHMYEFCGNNPLMFRDPWGLQGVGVTVYDGNDNFADGANGEQFKRAAKRDSNFNYDMGNDRDLKGLIDYLQMLKDHGCQIKSISVYDHGINGRCQEYNYDDIKKLPNAFYDMRSIGNMMSDEGVINMMGCKVGLNPELLQSYANAFNRKVTGSNLNCGYALINAWMNLYRPWWSVNEARPKK